MEDNLFESEIWNDENVLDNEYLDDITPCVHCPYNSDCLYDYDYEACYEWDNPKEVYEYDERAITERTRRMETDC